MPRPPAKPTTPARACVPTSAARKKRSAPAYNHTLLVNRSLENTNMHVIKNMGMRYEERYAALPTVEILKSGVVSHCHAAYAATPAATEILILNIQSHSCCWRTTCESTKTNTAACIHVIKPNMRS